jgi:hypothetical protein
MPEGHGNFFSLWGEKANFFFAKAKKLLIFLWKIKKLFQQVPV